MPRDIVLGNGELLINLDRHLSIRDIYYPYVGWANHVGGHRCRVGAWVVEGGFAWLDDSWDWQIKYVPDTLTTDCSARHHALGLRIRVCHTVLPDRNVLLQQYTIENMRDNAREVRLFFHHDLRIDESDIGDTAHYYPFESAMVHYKRNRYFLFSGSHEDARTGNCGISQYACGEKAFRGAEGTWRDAEDGHLSMNAIAQGSVDSVAGFSLNLPGKGEAHLQTWLAVGDSLETVSAMNRAIQTDGFDNLVAFSAAYWRRSVKDLGDHSRLPARVSELLTRSYLLIRTQADKRGAIIASNDSDIMETARAHYSYMWPRDGALTSYALDQLGASVVTRPFFEFCARALAGSRGALLHKYGPDGTLGASWHPYVTASGEVEIPFQEDGTALTVWALGRHHAEHGDTDFTARMYRDFVSPAATFLSEFRDPADGLPLPSWDLWEERRGVHLYTAVAVAAALTAAAELAREFDTPATYAGFAEAAERVREGILTHFWNDEAGRFARMLTRNAEGGGFQQDLTVDASAAALFQFGVFPADHPKVVATMRAIGTKLWVRAGMGGIARYERDYYFRVSDDFERVPGNPWVICTLWLADWYIAMAKTTAELKSALDLLEWAAICATRTGVLSEQVNPFTLEPLSVAPLTWSHAQFITTACGYLKKLDALDHPAHA